MARRKLIVVIIILSRRLESLSSSSVSLSHIFFTSLIFVTLITCNFCLLFIHFLLYNCLIWHVFSFILFLQLDSRVSLLCLCVFKRWWWIIARFEEDLEIFSVITTATTVWSWQVYEEWKGRDSEVDNSWPPFLRLLLSSFSSFLKSVHSFILCMNEVENQGRRQESSEDWMEVTYAHFSLFSLSSLSSSTLIISCCVQCIC